MRAGTGGVVSTTSKKKRVFLATVGNFNLLAEKECNALNGHTRSKD